MNKEDKPIGILDHFKEIKKRLIRYSLVLTSFTIVALIFYKRIISIFIDPANQIMNNSMRDGQIVFGRVTEAWGAAARVSIIIAFSLSLPFLLAEIIFFLKPGLRGKERLYLYILIPSSFIFFVIGVFFSYYMVIPTALKFLITFGSDIAQPMINIGPLTALMFSLMFWMGIVFQIPIIMFILGKLDLISYKKLKNYRRWIILISFILGAIITPTVDPLTQIIVAIPMIILFEIGLQLIRITEPEKKGFSFYLLNFLVVILILFLITMTILYKIGFFKELNVFSVL